MNTNNRNYKTNAYKLLPLGSKFFEIDSTLDGYDNDISYLSNMRLTAKAVLNELNRLNVFFKGKKSLLSIKNMI
jgi:hypothetical protein